jgi:hypothetical protein
MRRKTRDVAKDVTHIKKILESSIQPRHTRAAALSQLTRVARRMTHLNSVTHTRFLFKMEQNVKSKMEGTIKK